MEQQNDTLNPKQNKKRKKANGEGSIRKLANGKWTARIQIGYKPDGKQDIKAFYGKSEIEVKTKLKEFKKNGMQIAPIQIRNLTLQETISNWLYNYKILEIKPSSFDRLESTINKYIIPNIGRLKMANITSTDIQKIIKTTYDEQLSYSSIKKIKDCLNSYFNFEILKGNLKFNPCAGVSLPAKNKFKTKQIDIFSNEEINKIKNILSSSYGNGVKKYYTEYYFILILNTGMRVGELCSLQWEDVDFINKTLHVHRNFISQKKRNDKGQITKGYTLNNEGSVKTTSGNRFIPLNTTAISCLQNIQSLNYSNKYICVTPKGKYIAPNRLSSMFARVLKNANINHGSVHALRHTFASLLFKNNIDVKTVSELLGHSSISITYNTYIFLYVII
jgi:integrase